MEEAVAQALMNRAEQGQNKAVNIPMSSSPGVTMTSRIFGMGDAKRMSFDDGQMSPQAYSVSPTSSLLSSSPGLFSNPARSGRRDSLKNMWHLQDFGTTD